MALEPLKTRHPIVLAHGALGFVGYPGLEYFRGVRRMLEREGNRVFAWRVPNWKATVEQRARALLGHLREHGHEGPFHIIAHSMGGLDARHLISCLGAADLAVSLTTVATPHHGTVAAEVRNRAFRSVGLMSPRVVSARFLEHMAIFTGEWSRRFNDETPDAPHVRYRSWAGATPLWRTSPVLWPTHRLLTRREGPNDGLVSVASAIQRPELHAGTIPADHFVQLGWRTGLGGYDHRSLYRTMVRELVEAGL